MQRMQAHNLEQLRERQANYRAVTQSNATGPDENVEKN